MSLEFGNISDCLLTQISRKYQLCWFDIAGAVLITSDLFFFSIVTLTWYDSVHPIVLKIQTHRCMKMYI